MVRRSEIDICDNPTVKDLDAKGKRRKEKKKEEERKEKEK